MATYSSTIDTATSTESLTVTCAASGNLYVIGGRVRIETAATTIREGDLVRKTGGATPTNVTPEKANTRSGAADNTAASTWVTQPTEITGNAFVVIGVGQDQNIRAEWRPARPWAAYAVINGELIGLDIADAKAYTLIYNHEMCCGKAASRRGSRRGLWHWATHRAELAGAISVPGRNQTTSPWVSYRRIEPSWRQTNGLEVQLTTLPPAIQTPLLAINRFPMPEVYQRLATVSNNFGQVAFPLLGSWQPGTMDPPFVRAQYLLQEITPVPIPVGPPPALVPPPQPAATIPAISVAFYQQHPNPVTTAPAVGGIGGMTWYWP